MFDQPFPFFSLRGMFFSGVVPRAIAAAEHIEEEKKETEGEFEVGEEEKDRGDEEIEEQDASSRPNNTRQALRETLFGKTPKPLQWPGVFAKTVTNIRRDVS